MAANHIGLAAFLAVLVAGVLQSPARAQTAPPALAGTSWRAVELYGAPVAPAPPAAREREPHLVFGTDGRVSGADGCNRVTGPYTLKGDAVSFGQVAGTLMACPGTDEVSRRFRAALQGTGHVRLADGRLEFYGATGKPLAVFERRDAPAAAGSPLQGTRWQLVKFEGGDGRTLTPADRSRYTLEFAAGGRLAARLDCNRGGGTWKATTSGQLELGPLALTRARCPDPALHDQIARQWTFIRSFVLRDGHLFLSLMADGGIYEFEPAPPR